jgi:type IV pilus assembly protein PilN
MIRINLLQVERSAKPKARRSLSLGSGSGGGSSLQSVMPLISSLILVAGLAWIGYSFWGLYVRDQQLDQELAQARADEARLAPVLKQVEEFEARQKVLQQRVKLIEQLRHDQVVPVHLLDKISRSLPDRLWLTDMKQSEDSVQLDGQTSTLTALADFVGNLENSGYFVRPVEIISSEEQKNAGGAGNPNTVTLIKFSMRAQFVMPGSSPSGGGKPTATTPAGPRAH